MILPLSPAKAARELHQRLGWQNPGDLTIDEIAFYLGASVKEESLEGSEGRILMTNDSAIISVDSSIGHTRKRNFVLAHEIGHFSLHKDLKLCLDDNHTLSDWHKKGVHEQQANEFAAELLMPSSLFIKKAKGKKLNINLIEDIASYFGSSLTATFIKYCEVGDYPVMVIYIEDGYIKWKMHSRDFPFQFLPYGSKVPAWTVAGDYFNKRILESKPVKVGAIEWFPEDFQIKYKQGWQLWEQCYPVSSNGLISCIWSY